MPLSSARRALRDAAIVLLALAAVSFFTTARVTANDEARTEPRLELVHADGTAEPLVIARVAPRHSTWRRDRFDLRLGSKSFATTPGTEVVFVTDDSRAMSDRIVVRVPSPVPAVLAARVPVVEHPKFREVVLQISEERTGRPLIDAVFEAAEPDAVELSQHADEKAQVVLRAVNGRSGFVRWRRRGFWIHAPAHVGSEGPRWGTVPEATEIEDVLGGRPIPVRLPPFDERTQVEERRIRVAGADGVPIAGAFVWIPWALAVTPLGVSAGRLGDLCDGFRRTGADGMVSIPIFPASGLPVAAIDVRLPTTDAVIGGVPFLAYGLAYDALPKNGVREIRLPAVAMVEVTIEGLAPDSTVEIGADPLGHARTPLDGPVAPTILDPGVKELLANSDPGLGFNPALDLPKTRGAVIAACEFDLRGSFRSGGPPYRRPVPVGRAITLWIERTVGPRDADGEVPVERRRIEVTPDKPGPLRVTRRWEQLARAE